jgi:protein-tyrosine phosphatase
MPPDSFVDIHCHLLPGIDDGSKNLDESLEMARIAVAEGTSAIIVTPHQLSSYTHNDGNTIRAATQRLQDSLDENQIPLKLAPGGDVRIEDGMLRGIKAGTVMTLADHGRHVLLELPHELYVDLRPLLLALQKSNIQGILSHPERNHGLLARPKIVEELVDAGCLMQVTAGSLLGTFGPASQAMAEGMIRQGTVHFLATDAHGSRSRRPLMQRGFDRVVEIAGAQAALTMCCHFPRAVFDGKPVSAGRLAVAMPAKSWFTGWGSSKKPTWTAARQFTR